MHLGAPELAADLSRPGMLVCSDRGQRPCDFGSLVLVEGGGTAGDHQLTGLGVPAGDHRLGPLGHPVTSADDYLGGLRCLTLIQTRSPGR